MRLPGSNLPLPNIIAWSIVLAGVTFGLVLIVGSPLSSTLAHSPLFLVPGLVYAGAIGLVLRRAWISSVIFSQGIRLTLALPVVLVLAGSAILNVVPVKSPEFGYTDDSPFVTADSLVPQTGWGWPYFYLRVFEKPLEGWGGWVFDGSSAFFSLWFWCSLLLFLVSSEAVAVGIWRYVQRRWEMRSKRRPGLA